MTIANYDQEIEHRYHPENFETEQEDERTMHNLGRSKRKRGFVSGVSVARGLQRGGLSDECKPY